MSERLPAWEWFNRFRRAAAHWAGLAVWLAAGFPVLAQDSHLAAAPLTAPSLPDAGVSVFRIFGALALVVGLFLGGVWLFRNWQRLALRRGRIPKLNILETRGLGGRHALYVVGYEDERFLIASSPAGVNLLSHLASGADPQPPAADANPAPSFPRTLARMLQGK